MAEKEDNFHHPDTRGRQAGRRCVALEAFKTGYNCVLRPIVALQGRAEACSFSTEAHGAPGLWGWRPATVGGSGRKWQNAAAEN